MAAKKRIVPDRPNLHAGASPAELVRAAVEYLSDPRREPNDRTAVAIDYMRRWVEANPGRNPDLAVWCVAPYRDKPCNTLMGQVWTTPATFTNRTGEERHGHYFRATMQPFAEGFAAQDNLADNRIDHGQPTVAANVRLYSATSDRYNIDGCLEVLLGLDVNPRVDGVVFGCGRHEQTMVAIPTLVREADSTRNKLNLAGDSRSVGYTSA